MLIFVYGTLKKGFSNHSFLKDADFIGDGITESNYTMYVRNIPYVSFYGNESQIHGEIYEIDEEILIGIDYLEGHPDFYKRGLTRILNNGNILHCFMYFCDDIDKLSSALITDGIYRL